MLKDEPEYSTEKLENNLNAYNKSFHKGFGKSLFEDTENEADILVSNS